MARSSVRVLVASIVTSVVCATANAQQLQWFQSPVNGHWYGVEYTTRSWMQGEAEAVSLGGHLATVRSQSENAWIAAALGALAAPNNEGFWIGANDAQVEGHFVWSSGETPAFANWYPGEPNNLFDEDYVQIGTNFAWNDRDDAGPTNPRPLVELNQLTTAGWSWPTSYPTGDVAAYHTVADVNADGLPDLVVPNNSAGTISILLNVGGGQFSSGVTFNSAPGPMSVAVADLDHDGRADIAVSQYEGQSLAIYFGTTGGSYTTGPVYPLGGRGHQVVAADLDGNGWSDLAVTSIGPQPQLQSQLLVFLNDQLGGFLAPRPYPAQVQASFVTAGDLDGDHDVDLVVANSGSSSVGLYFNSGSGVFSARSYLTPSVPGASRVAIADLDGDGKVDLSIPSQAAAELQIWNGDGQGGFAFHSSIALPFTSRWVDAADINRDGLGDLALGYVGLTPILTVLLATQPGVYGPPTELSGSNDTASLMLADLDGDGMVDISASGHDSDGVAVILSNYDCSQIASYCTSSTTTHGCTPVMAGTGGPSASQSSGFNITVTGVEGQKNGLIFYGTSPTAVAWAIGSYSYVCVAPPVQRTAITNSGGTLGVCDGVLTLDFNSFMAANPTAYGNPFMAGEAFYAQGWFRDPGAVKGTNLSNGLQFRLCN